MWKIVVGFFIFCLVLFIYLHIQFHLKTSNDLEMYEVEQCSKEKLEEICDIRQPVLFDLECKKIMDTTNQDFIFKNYSAFEVKIRNLKDDDINSELYIPLSLDAAKKLFQEDKQSIYLTENNGDFLQETGVIKNMSFNDEILRPYLVSNCNYDLLMGSYHSHTIFKYEINYRNYFLLTQGSAQIKLAPPQSGRYLHTIYDYENFEFKSPIDPWNIQAKYKADFDKIKCLEFALTPGKTLFIPAYWWYSIRLNSPETSISVFKYKTYMNNLAILPYWCMYGLQMQNIKRNNNKKKVTFNENNNETNIYDNLDILEQTNKGNVALDKVESSKEYMNTTSDLESSTSLSSIGSTLL